MLLVLIVMALTTLGAAAMVLAIESPPKALEQRFSDLAVKVRRGRGNMEDSEAASAGTARMLLNWTARRLPAPKADNPRGERRAQRLAQAGFSGPNAPRMFAAIRLSGVIAGAALGLFIGLAVRLHGALTLLGVCGALAGAFLPPYYVAARARRRQRAIAADLSDILDMLVVSVEAGVGLHEAIREVGADAVRRGRVIGRELALISGEMLAGSTLGQALRAWANRTSVEDIKPLAATLIQSEQLGSQLGPALRAASDALRAKRRLQAEERAHKATVKILFPLVLLVLPAMLLVVLGPVLVEVFKTLGAVIH
jgi:tight adherence protein C